MSKNRLEAFSDGVIAIIITIMVLEFRVPASATWGALLPLVPNFISYLLSFVMVGIYWNNHHHMIHAAKSVSGRILWANLHLLFWLTLIPFATAWVGQDQFAQVPVMAMGFDLEMAAVAYALLFRALVQHDGRDSEMAKAASDWRKEIGSLLLYPIGMGLTFVHPWLGFGTYGLVAALWFIPDLRFERAR